MEHYIVVHTVTGECTVESFHRLFGTLDDAKTFALQVAADYKVDAPEAKVVETMNAVSVDYGDGDIDYLFIHQVVDDSTVRTCPHCGKRVVPSTVGQYRWSCEDCEEDFYDFECN